MLARRAGPLEALAAAQESAIAPPCDVTDEAAVERAFAEIADRAGRLDVLFNNAGTFGPAGPMRISEIPDSDYAKSRTAVSVIPGQHGHG